MTMPSTTLNRRLSSLTAASALSSLLLTACGGGAGSETVATSAAAPQVVATASRVRLEGCVVNTEWMGEADVPVHARTADGRAVGTAFTNARGVFVMDVPARAGIVVNTAADMPGGLSLTTGSAPLSVAACLLTGV